MGFCLNKRTLMKELRLTASTAEGDLKTKAKQADKFLAKMDQVRFNVRLKGRLINRPELAFEVLDKITSMLTNMAKCSKYTTKGNIVSCTMNPKKQQKPKE